MGKAAAFNVSKTAWCESALRLSAALPLFGGRWKDNCPQAQKKTRRLHRTSGLVLFYDRGMAGLSPPVQLSEGARPALAGWGIKRRRDSTLGSTVSSREPST